MCQIFRNMYAEAELSSRSRSKPVLLFCWVACSPESSNTVKWTSLVVFLPAWEELDTPEVLLGEEILADDELESYSHIWIVPRAQATRSREPSLFHDMHTISDSNSITPTFTHLYLMFCIVSYVSMVTLLNKEILRKQKCPLYVQRFLCRRRGLKYIHSVSIGSRNLFVVLQLF